MIAENLVAWEKLEKCLDKESKSLEKELRVKNSDNFRKKRDFFRRINGSSIEITSKRVLGLIEQQLQSEKALRGDEVSGSKAALMAKLKIIGAALLAFGCISFLSFKSIAKGKSANEVYKLAIENTAIFSKGLFTGYQAHLKIPKAIFLASGELPFAPKKEFHDPALDATAVEVVGTVTDITGKNLSIDDLVAPRTTLITEGNSHAILRFPDGTQIFVGENSVVKIEYPRNTEPRLLTLEKGSIQVTVPGNQQGSTNNLEKLVVRTRSTAVGVIEGVSKIELDLLSGETRVETINGSATMTKLNNRFSNPVLALHANKGVQIIKPGKVGSITDDFIKMRSSESSSQKSSSFWPFGSWSTTYDPHLSSRNRALREAFLEGTEGGASNRPSSNTVTSPTTADFNQSPMPDPEINRDLMAINSLNKSSNLENRNREEPSINSYSTKQVRELASVIPEVTPQAQIDATAQRRLDDSSQYESVPVPPPFLREDQRVSN